MVHHALLRALFLIATSTLLLVQPNPCRRIFSAPNLLTQQTSASHYGACLSTLHSFSFATKPVLVPAKFPSFNSSHSVFSLHTFSNRPFCVSKAFSSHPAGRSVSCPPFPVLQTSRCHCGHLMLKSRVSHKTAPARPLTLPPGLNLDKMLPPTSFCSLAHFPIPTHFEK